MSTATSTLFARTNRPLWLVTAAAGNRQGGLIASFVSEASIVPEMPRVVVGIARHHFTWQLVEESNAFAVHLLGEAQIDLVWRFGLRSGHELDKFQGLNVATGPAGSPIVADTLGWMDCRIEGKLDTGDRTLYVAEVVQAQVQSEGPPVTARRMVELASPEQLTELKDQMARDSALDAEAIRAWRTAHSAG